MDNTKMIVTGALMAAIAAIFQSLPIFLSEMAVLLTVLSAVPIYNAARSGPTSGVLSYIVAAILIMFFSTHEALFFLCSNGIVGLSLGICRYFKLNRYLIVLLSSATLTLSLSIMNFGIGIPIFGQQIPGMFLIQLAILFLFSCIYNFIYLLFSDFIYKRIRSLP